MSTPRPGRGVARCSRRWLVALGALLTVIYVNAGRNGDTSGGLLARLDTMSAVPSGTRSPTLAATSR